MLAAQIKEYDDFWPGKGELIVDAQFLAPSRRQDKLVEAEIVTNTRGQGWAIFLAVACVVLAAVFFFQGNNYAGSAFLGIFLVTLVGSFLPWSRRKE